MFNIFELALRRFGAYYKGVEYRKKNLKLQSPPKYKLPIYIEQLEQESIVQRLMRDDPEFKAGIEKIAQKLSDKNSTAYPNK